jgi:hypothetical protein
MTAPRAKKGPDVCVERLAISHSAFARQHRIPFEIRQTDKSRLSINSIPIPETICHGKKQTKGMAKKKQVLITPPCGSALGGCTRLAGRNNAPYGACSDRPSVVTVRPFSVMHNNNTSS